MYIPIQTNKSSINRDEELILDLKTIKNNNGEFLVKWARNIFFVTLAQKKCNIFYFYQMITMARGIWILRNPVWSFQIFSVINLTSSPIFPKRKNLYFKYNLQHKNIFPVLFFLGGKIGQGRIRILDFFKASNFPKN